ncbi:MAG: alpha/beta hydrolase [Actinomycetota bacterium]
MRTQSARKMFRWCVPMVITALALAACTGSDRTVSSIDSPPPAQEELSAPSVPAGLERFYTQRLQWSGCGGDFQCAKLTVPIDYAEPAGATIQLALIRLPAGQGDDRLGSLLMNPGGPGGSGVEYARSARAVISRPVRDAYDIVGFDPRGVGDSAPIQCLTDEQTDEFVAADPTPDDAAEVTATVKLLQQLADGCRDRDQGLLAHVDTESAARDMDVLRAAVGDRRLSYLGKSYGTFLGATYADLFPTNVGRMVLDGALDPALSGEEVSLGQARGFEQATQAFVADCVQSVQCPVGSDPARGLSRIQDFVASLDQQPLPTDESQRPLTEALGVLGIVVAMYDETAWPVLQQALDEAFGGDGTALLELADLYTERGGDGRYKTNSNVAILAVNCLDRPDRSGVAGARKLLPEFTQASPTWGRFLAWGGLSCAYWPVQSDTKPRALRAVGSSPITVIGTTRDPATPYEWAESLTDQLVEGRLVSYDGDGHTAYQRGSRCIDDAVDAHLLRGVAPTDGLRC